MEPSPSRTPPPLHYQTRVKAYAPFATSDTGAGQTHARHICSNITTIHVVSRSLFLENKSRSRGDT